MKIEDDELSNWRERATMISLVADAMSDMGHKTLASVIYDAVAEFEILHKRLDAMESGIGNVSNEPLVWIDAPREYPEDGYYWHKTEYGSVDLGYGCGDCDIYSTVTHIAGPIQLIPPVDK